MLKKLIIIILLISTTLFTQSFPKKTEFDKNWSNPKKFPDHILLSYSDDPATTVSVTWRTSREINKGFGEIAKAKANPEIKLV